MKRIDSPQDVALSQIEKPDGDPILNLIMKVGGAAFIPLGIVTAIKEQFSEASRKERLIQFLKIFNSELEQLTTQVAAIDSAQNSPKFIETMRTAAEEAIRTSDAKKVSRLACAVANSLDPNTIQPDDDLPSFIRDVAQLSESDIKTLEIIISSSRYQLFVDTYNPKTSDIDLGHNLIEGATREKISSDDFYSTAYRLVGFGLALEVPSQSGRRSANDLRFIPTKRGRKLLELLTKRS